MDAVDLDAEWLDKADVTDVFCLTDGREGVEPSFVEESITTEGVDGEVGDAEGGEVLEEVGAL